MAGALRLLRAGFQNLHRTLEEQSRAVHRVKNVVCIGQWRFAMTAECERGRAALAAHFLQQQFSLLDGNAVADDDKIEGFGGAQLDSTAYVGDGFNLKS